MAVVHHLRGAMHPRNYVRITGLTEADLDRQIADNRARYDDACDAAYEALLARRREAKRPRPSLIPLDHSLLARGARWLRNLSLKGPRT